METRLPSMTAPVMPGGLGRCGACWALADVLATSVATATSKAERSAFMGESPLFQMGPASGEKVSWLTRWCLRRARVLANRANHGKICAGCGMVREDPGMTLAEAEVSNQRNGQRKRKGK